ncbi:MarR family transcriptional regulator [Staphylococcus sp. 18_1_E_LY]|uniref:MarR family transcriptional regulator n=1 Tax=Staphylococcus lloydii TaxID=2781774 RepID=A0A7T1F9H7_9STAP|nr:MarR family transcriptional regulator [Staphylococcus lloydii]MBF7019951.1 MarR family transcriptional regulator [Staphylococcus lloydii]MBF7027634.1 MarR family transcriptional regulator [Staphylococcus lloydii]QPM75317.1 MarR family transcriptional regulator [Staphylococcus lloydii]
MNEKEFEYRDIKFIGKLSSKIYRRGNIYITEKLKPYGINYIQMMCLVALYIEDGIRQEEIVEDIGIDKASVTRAIKSLEDNAYLTRTRNESDKRAFNLYLTDKAMEFKEISWKFLSEWELMISEGIDDKDKAIAFNVLNQMSINADKYYKDEN